MVVYCILKMTGCNSYGTITHFKIVTIVQEIFTTHGLPHIIVTDKLSETIVHILQEKKFRNI